MKKLEFNKIIKSCTKKGFLAAEKVAGLDELVKRKVVNFLVRQRGPIVAEFIPKNYTSSDWGWLHSMGYIHETQGEKYRFYHTSEHEVS